VHLDLFFGYKLKTGRTGQATPLVPMFLRSSTQDIIGLCILTRKRGNENILRTVTDADFISSRF